MCVLVNLEKSRPSRDFSHDNVPSFQTGHDIIHVRTRKSRKRAGLRATGPVWNVRVKF